MKRKCNFRLGVETSLIFCLCRTLRLMSDVVAVRTGDRMRPLLAVEAKMPDPSMPVRMLLNIGRLHPKFDKRATTLPISNGGSLRDCLRRSPFTTILKRNGFIPDRFHQLRDRK